MTRKECLDAAAGCVLKDRQNEYGKPEDCFGMISIMWSAYLGGVCISAHDVAAMMALLKIARFRHNPSHEDNAVDCAGYAACMVECATAWKCEGEDEGGCCQNGNDQPEFKPGDRVEFYEYNPNGNMWLSAEYVGKRNEVDRSWHAVKRLDSGKVVLVHCGHLRKSEAKAEGCEDLVFDEARMRESMPGLVPQDGPSDFDAPQSKEELMQRIMDANPAIYSGGAE